MCVLNPSNQPECQCPSEFPAGDPYSECKLLF
jgi:hypothetical protein